MKNNVKSNGVFIVLEGIDGAGKTTLLKKMDEWFQQQGLETVVTREPGGTKLATYLRAALQHNAHGDEAIDPETEMMLFNASRIHNVNTIIRPGLEAGKIVLCDRFGDSTLAYQGAGRGMDITKLSAFHQTYIKLYPDVTFLVDGNPEVFLQRLEERKSKLDNLDGLGLPFYQRARDFYLQQATESSENYVILNGEQTPEELFKSSLPNLETIKNWIDL